MTHGFGVINAQKTNHSPDCILFVVGKLTGYSQYVASVENL